MSKKRPSLKRRLRPLLLRFGKFEVAYWRTRLFRNTYTVGGKCFETSHWSVKIQHRGERRTFSLTARDTNRAAAEACQLYTSIIRQGWENSTRLQTYARTATSRKSQPDFKSEQFDADYRMERLINRPYAMEPVSLPGPELSIRIEHEGISQYFPLNTEDPRIGADRAVEIHRSIVEQGWERTFLRFKRELTVGFRWIDNPQSWTYTTICTQPLAASQTPMNARISGTKKKGVVIVERDGGVRNALAWCLNRMSEFYCSAAFPSVARAVANAHLHARDLILISHHLSDSPGLAQLSEASERGDHLPVLRYSTYPDSESLFAATPGGAVCYLLRRRLPTEFLEPINQLPSGRLSQKELGTCAWNYFKDLFAARPTSVADQILNSLTQREHEVLALLSSGSPDKEIASRLGISIYTVHGHVRNIYVKLGVHNRTGAVVKYMQK